MNAVVTHVTMVNVKTSWMATRVNVYQDGKEPTVAKVIYTFIVYTSAKCNQGNLNDIFIIWIIYT